MDAHGDVVGEDGEVELLVQDAEVLLDLGHAAQGVERSSGDQDVGAELLRDATVLEHALGLGIDDADHHRHAMVDDADGLGDDLATTLVGGEHDLARRPQEEQAVDARSPGTRWSTMRTASGMIWRRRSSVEVRPRPKTEEPAVDAHRHTVDAARSKETTSS